MPEQNTNRALTEAAADEWKVLPSGLTVLVRPMPGYSGTHVIYATRFGQKAEQSRQLYGTVEIPVVDGFDFHKDVASADLFFRPAVCRHAFDHVWRLSIRV